MWCYPSWLEVHLCTCVLLFSGLISLIFWLLKKKTTRVVKDFFVFVLKRNNSVIKTLCKYYRGKQQLWWKTSFCLKRNDTTVKTLCYIYLFLTIKDLVIKPSHILRITALKPPVVAPIILFVKILDSGLTAHGIWMEYAHWYICIYFYRRDNDLVVQKLFNMTLSCTLFIIWGKSRSVDKTSVIHLVYKEKQFFCKNSFILICVWCLTCWPESTNVSHFAFCLFVSGKTCALIHSYRTLWCLYFCHFRLNYNNIVCICLFRMDQ